MKKAVIGKRINYITLHDFLYRLNVVMVRSRLHSDYTSIIEVIEREGCAVWNDVRFTKESFMEALTEQEGVVKSLSVGREEMTIQFVSGNEFVIEIEDPEHHMIILDYLQGTN